MWALPSFRYYFWLSSHEKWYFLNFFQRCILDIDVQGARSVRASSLEAVFIFICPPSMEELEKRLRDRYIIPSYWCISNSQIIPSVILRSPNLNVLSRGTETEEQVLKRLRNAQTEIEQGKSSGIFDFILYNDKLEECYESLKVNNSASFM